MKRISVMMAAAIFAAVFCLHSATPLEMTQANVQFNLALNYYKAGKLGDAADTLEKALDVVPDHPQANLLLGLIRNQQGDFKRAIAPLKLAAKEMPDNFDVFNNLGIASYQIKDAAGAETAFRSALAIKPDRADVWINLGVLELGQKKWKDAEDAFSKSAQLNPNDVKAFEGLAESAGQASDTKVEIDALTKSLALSNDADVRLSLAQKLYSDNQIDQALQVLAPLQDKGNSEAEFLLGCVLYRKAHFDDSRDRFEAALKDRPDYPEARFNLAITLYDQNKFGDALDQFKEVLKDHPGDTQAKTNMEITRRAAVRSYLKAGSEDFLEGDYLSAMDQWHEALGLESDNKVIKDLVGTAQAQLKLQAADLGGKGDLAYQAGNVEAAVTDWGQALERDPENADAKAGMDKVKSEVKKLSEIYEKNYNDLIQQDELVEAGVIAKRLEDINASRGKAVMKEWTLKVGARVQELSTAADEATQRGDLRESVDKLEQAVRFEGKDTGLQLRLNEAKVALHTAIDQAMTQAKDAEVQKNHVKALKDYRMVLELEPVNTEAQAEARRLAKLLKSKTVDSAQLDAWYYQGVYAYAAGDIDKAMGYWKQVLDADPQNRLANDAVNRANRRLKALSNVR